jgi:hypothetical protein
MQNKNGNPKQNRRTTDTDQNYLLIKCKEEEQKAVLTDLFPIK